MADLIMTSYKPRAEPHDEVDPRISLIVESASQLEPQSQSQCQTINGHSCHNGASFAHKKKLCIKQKVGLIKNRRRCLILIAVILTLIIVSIVAIILAVCLRFSDEDSSLGTSTPTHHAVNSSAWTTKNPFTTSASTIQAQTTSGYIPKIINYVTYGSPGDSRVFQIEKDGGDIIRTYGTKSTHGRLLSLNHVSVSNGSGRDTHIRLGTRNNMASVMLPDGTHISYDMSQNVRNVEMRIFTSGGVVDLEPKKPGAYVQAVAIDSNVSVLTKLLFILSRENRVEDTNHVVGKRNNTCIPYLPLRVTKCGSQYPYEGAFVEGRVRIGENSPALMAALPWPSQPDDCFQVFSSSASTPNYYIPFPIRPGDTSEFCESYVEYIHSVCTNRDIYEDALVNTTCTYLALKTSNAQYGDQVIYTSVFNSCLAIFNSIKYMCSYLQYSIGILTPTWRLSKRDLSGVCRSGEDSESRAILPKKDVSIDLHVLAFCPSRTPILSPEQTIIINVNQSKSVGSPIHINCEGSPEVTFMSVGHAFTGSESLDRVMHRFKVCSICAFETSVRAVLNKDQICCNNTCLDNQMCTNGRTPAIEESTFKRHSSVYCHDFLADRGYSTNPLDRKCVGNCDTRFSLEFTMLGVSSKRTFYRQRVVCLSSNTTSCEMEFGQ